MTTKKDSPKTTQKSLEEEIVVMDPAVVPIIFHEKKSMLLQLLIAAEMTIIEIKNAIGMNPGTIKRHLDDLLNYDLVFISRTEKNEFGMVMKYYRASAKKFSFDLKWPQK